jgi:ABC-2 type transport system permease protein
MTKSSLNHVWILMRREIWESPVAFKWTPLGIGALIIVFTIIMLVLGARFDNQMAFTLDAMRLFSDMPFEQKRLIVSGLLFASSNFFLQLMILIILFYLAGSLFDDRKDRSILFWKSLPVSDGMTVASKLLTACVMVPALFLLAIILTQLALLAIASIYSLLAGVNPFSHIWVPASLPRLWTVMALGMLVQALWLLPIYAWLLFCSSWAPRLPILIAIAIPAGLAIAQHSYSLISGFRLPDYNIGAVILRRLGSGVLPGNANIDFSGGVQNIEFNEELFMSFSTIFNHLLKPEMWLGWLIAAVFLYGAVWFRRRASDQ